MDGKVDLRTLSPHEREWLDSEESQDTPLRMAELEVSRQRLAALCAEHPEAARWINNEGGREQVTKHDNRRTWRGAGTGKPPDIVGPSAANGRMRYRHD